MELHNSQRSTSNSQCSPTLNSEISEISENSLHSLPISPARLEWQCLVTTWQGWLPPKCKERTSGCRYRADLCNGCGAWKACVVGKKTKRYWEKNPNMVYRLAGATFEHVTPAKRSWRKYKQKDKYKHLYQYKCIWICTWVGVGIFQ